MHIGFKFGTRYPISFFAQIMMKTVNDLMQLKLRKLLCTHVQIKQISAFFTLIKCAKFRAQKLF